MSIARRYNARVYALHVFEPGPYVYTTPEVSLAAIEAEEENAKAQMQRVESQLTGLWHETLVERGVDIHDAAAQAIKDFDIDLVIIGTHGRTDAQKLLIGSVAEEIFRRSPVPVLAIGPGVQRGSHSAGLFHCVLFATDFTAASTAAAPCAVSLAYENQARLLLLHVMRSPEMKSDKEEKHFELSVAKALHKLCGIVPANVQLGVPPEVAVEYGEPGTRIVEAVALSS